jgi:CHAT domain-containing protein/tetratricopeptide (TPR) repeat protein
LQAKGKDFSTNFNCRVTFLQTIRQNSIEPRANLVPSLVLVNRENRAILQAFTRQTGMINLDRVLIVLSTICLCVVIGSAPSHAQPTSKAAQDYVPPELQASHPEITAYLDSSEKLGQAGNYGEVSQQLRKALDLCTSKGFIADRAIIEAHLGSAYFLQGKLEDAKQSFLNAFSDSLTSKNLVLQADVLVALSSIAQGAGQMTEALDLVTKALGLARSSKDLFIQSRCLGELGRLQFTMTKLEEARNSVEEALRIDRLNQYKWEPGHLLYLAWITYNPSKPDEAIQLANSARELAVKQENYLVFMQASESLGQAFVAKGDLTKAITLLEHSREGVSENGKPLFQRPDSYRAAMGLPYPKIVFLEAIALAYQKGQRTEEALKSWQQLHDTANSVSFFLAAAEASHSMANIYETKKDAAKAIASYALATEEWAKGGNGARRIDALNSEAFLLQQQGEAEKAILLYEELLPLLDSVGNHSRQFLIELAIAEIAQPRGDLERAGTALARAESLLSPDLTLSGVESQFIFQMYTREAGIHETRKEPLPQMIAMEKAISSAEAGATGDQRAILDREMGRTLESMHAREMAAQAEKSGELAKALRLYELIQHFEATHARWSDKGKDYNSKTDDPMVGKVLEIPFKLILQPEGSVELEANLQQMGPIAQMARLPILIALSNHYFMERKHALVVKFATLALPQLLLEETGQPNRWDVQLSCELAVSLLLQGETQAATRRVDPCLRSAKKLGDPQLLMAAHQTKVWVLQAAGRENDAQESVQFLLQNAPQDPTHFVELAQLSNQRGDQSAELKAWRQALHLFEVQKNVRQMASVHLSLANSLSFAATRDTKEEHQHFDAALSLYRELGDLEGQANANIGLGRYFTQEKERRRALESFDAALKLARQLKRRDLEAYVLSLIGNAFRETGEPSRSLGFYRNAAEVYHNINDLAEEAFQWRYEAWALNDLHRPEASLEASLRSQKVADVSGAWRPRYWTRRFLAGLYERKGEYESGIRVLREARSIAAVAEQPLSAAWAALDLAAFLSTVGEREEAQDELNLALPVFRKFKDAESEGRADLNLMEIYGARESELKDFEKALAYYQAARVVAEHHDPTRVPSLNLDAVEIYWQQKRFKEAESLANEALNYYQGKKDDWGETSSLLSLAEIERESGAVDAAARNMKRIELLMKHIDDFYLIGRFHYGMANQQRVEGHYREAIDEYERVITMLEQFKSSATDASLRGKVSNTYGFIYDELIDTYYRLSEQQPLSKFVQADRALQHAELNKSRVFTISWGRTFVEALRRQLPAALQEKERLLSSRQDELRAELEKAQSGQGARSLKQVQEDQKHLADELDQFAKELRQGNPSYAEACFPQITGIATLPLRPGEVFLEFKVLDEALLVWMIESTERGSQLIAFYKVEHPRAWFEDRILALRGAFNRASPELFDPLISEDLFNALFPAGVAGRLSSAKALIFVPDDVLFLLPFELLSPDASRSQFVLLQMPTSYFPSAAALRLSRSLSSTGHVWQAQFLGLADPVTSAGDERYTAANFLAEMDRTKAVPLPHDSVSPVRGPLSDDLMTRNYFFSRLPDTATEVRNIAALFPADASNTVVRTGVDARKRDLLETDLGRFRFVHFATHGFFPVEPGIREPALILSYDGKDEERMMLTLSEVIHLRLHAEMVVLSACNTGSGKVTRAEGVSSLGSAFLAAGASSVTMSLWKVSDKSTAILMEEFYRNLLRGMPKNAALAVARSAVFSKGYRNPFFWAPFVLTGE